MKWQITMSPIKYEEIAEFRQLGFQQKMEGKRGATLVFASFWLPGRAESFLMLAWKTEAEISWGRCAIIHSDKLSNLFFWEYHK